MYWLSYHSHITFISLSYHPFISLSYHPLNKNLHHQHGNGQHSADHLSQSGLAITARFQQKRGGQNGLYSFVHSFTKDTKYCPAASKYTEHQHHLSINIIRASSKINTTVIIMSHQWPREGLGNLSLQLQQCWSRCGSSWSRQEAWPKRRSPVQAPPPAPSGESGLILISYY